MCRAQQGARAGGLARLAYLNLYHNKIDEPGISALVEAFDKMTPMLFGPSAGAGLGKSSLDDGAMGAEKLGLAGQTTCPVPAAFGCRHWCSGPIWWPWTVLIAAVCLGMDLKA